MCFKAYLNFIEKQKRRKNVILLGKKKYITIFMFVYFLLGFFPQDGICRLWKRIQQSLVNMKLALALLHLFRPTQLTKPGLRQNTHLFLNIFTEGPSCWMCRVGTQGIHFVIPIPHRCPWPHSWGQHWWWELLAFGRGTGERTSEALSLPGWLLWLWKATQFNVCQGKIWKVFFFFIKLGSPHFWLHAL